MGGQETFLRLFWNIHLCQHSCARCLCYVLHLGDVAPDPFLVEEVLLGKKPVRQEVQGQVWLVPGVDLSLGVMPAIPQRMFG